MKKTLFCTLVCIICVLALNVLPVVSAMTDHFSDSVILVIGKSNSVSSTALWLFGVKCIFNSRVIIRANGGEGEKVNAFMLSPKIGFYVGHEDIVIHMERAKGLFFWGEKSLFVRNTPPGVFALCKARDIWVTYD
jgi:hypothetical protein